jgi:hypothetical protein
MDGSHFGLTTDDSLYYRYNSTMRARVPEEVALWADFSRIIDSALHKLPSQEATVYRGFHVSLTQVSHEFQPGSVVWLVSITSTTTDEKQTLKFFGSGSSSSPGTLMKIHAVSAKDISAFSVLPSESELVFPLNTCLSIERVVTSQELMSLKGLIEDLPENVDLIVARQQCVSKDLVTAAIAKDADALAVFESQHFPSSQSSTQSAYTLSLPASASSPEETMPASGRPFSPSILAPESASRSLSLVSFSEALSALKSAVSDSAAAAIAYYDDIEFAAQLCSDAATQHGANYAISVPLQEACISLKRIIASKPLSMPSKITLSSALADAESTLHADPGLKAARQKIQDAGHKQELELRSTLSRDEQQLNNDLSRAEKECQNISVKVQADEYNARSSAANDVRLLGQQLGVNVQRINQMKDEETRALAAQDFKSAQDINSRLRAYIAECSQSVQLATSNREVELEQHLLQLRTVARDASAAAQQRVVDKRSSLEAAAADHRNQLQQLQAATARHLQDCDSSNASLSALIARARELLGRQPAWPVHEELLCFDLPLNRLTTHFFVTKKWFPRYFCMRGCRLYYADGSNGYPDNREGTLEFLRSKPAPDGRYCVDLQGMCALPMSFTHYHVLMLRRLHCCLQGFRGRTSICVRDHVCRKKGWCCAGCRR